VTARESQKVELVDTSGHPMGSTSVEDAHQPPGRLHRAFSVFLRDPDGRVLLQQRAEVKTRFPLRWANSCCGHPAPGEEVAHAASLRLGEELGVQAPPLTEIGVYTYFAEDPATGRVEHEYDHVLVGEVPPGLSVNPDPNEVADTRWVTVPALLGEMARESRAYAPWLFGVTSRLAEANPDGQPLRDAPERSGGR
jgi:isopentenyl-diphosphate delta-isomerase